MSIAQKHVKEWKEAPAEFREKFDVLANAHKAFESKLVNLEVTADVDDPDTPDRSLSSTVAIDAEPALQEWANLDALKGAKTIAIECDSAVAGLMLLRDQDGHIYGLNTQANAKTLPKGTHVGGVRRRQIQGKRPSQRG